MITDPSWEKIFRGAGVAFNSDWRNAGMTNANAAAPLVTYASGMQRSERKPRLDLIDSDWLRGVAKVMTVGAAKYGDNNWRKGDRDAAVDALNHLQDHLLKLKDGDTTEEHIYHLSCNAMFLSYYLQLYPDLFTKETPVANK